MTNHASEHAPDPTEPTTTSDSLGVTRRAFLQGAGVSALGTTILEVGHAATQTLSSSDVYGPGATPIELTINDEKRTVHVDPATTLVEVLRNELGMTGTKIGCDRGACSACTVWIDDDVAASCMTLAMDVRGKRITTIEGLARDGELHPVQRAFVEHDALQCGFCTPGMVMSCAHLVDNNPDCELEDVQAAISGHLCRCGAYPNIFKATLAAASGARKQREG